MAANKNTENQVVELDLHTSDTETVQPETLHKVWVMDEKTNDYKQVEVPESKASIIYASQMAEAWERMDGDRMATGEYEPTMHRCWVNRDKSDPATIAAYERGYRPVRDRDAAMKSGHAYGKVDGFEGEVVHIGDAVLMHVPKPIVEAREARALDLREREKRSNKEAARNHMEGVMDRYKGVNDSSTGVLDEYRGMKLGYEKNTGIVGTYDENDRSMAAANSLVAAQERMKRDQSGTSFFGGFNGGGDKNPLPESPLVRRLLAESQTQ